MIIEYCKSINKAGIGYIDKMVQSWAEKEISTHEQAEAEIRRLQSLHTLEGQVVSKLGLNRGLTKKEREYIETWANNGITIELVEYAYEKTVNATGKASFGYMNTIIMDWVKNNLYTIPEIDSYNERYSKSKYKQKKNDPSAKPPAESDSSEHSYDLNKLLEHAMNNIPTIKEN
jgi:DnaD/phage-associated family protein